MMSYRVQRPITTLINGHKYRVGDVIPEQVLLSLKNPRSFSMFVKNGYLVPTVPEPKAAVAVLDRPSDALVAQVEPANTPEPAPPAPVQPVHKSDRKGAVNKPRGRPRTKK